MGYSIYSIMNDTINIKDIKKQLNRYKPLETYSNDRFIRRKAIELLIYAVVGAIAVVGMLSV